MEEVIAQAADKGMYVVDNNDLEAVLDDYDDKLEEADKLCEIVDPENKPFESKYKAREILDQLCNKLEANRTIASLEKKKGVIEALDFRIASIRVRTGTICWECEEPHNAQTDLERACDFFIPGMVSQFDELTKDEKAETTPKVVEVTDPIPIPTIAENMCADTLKCLNILGILWSGRGQVAKALLYLNAAYEMYEKNISHVRKKKFRADMENSFTHNLFYLAQAHGHLGDSKKSSLYCYKTLQRQLDAGLNDIKSALDWVKNCAGMADFYSALRQYNNCALALASAESVLKAKVISELKSSGENGGPVNFIVGNLNAAEIEAELNKRWALLDVAILRRAHERENVRKTAVEMGLDLTTVLSQDLTQNDEGDFDAGAAFAKQLPQSVFQSSIAEATAAAAVPEVLASLFTGLKVPLVSHLSGGDIQNFESARIVFLRAATRIEASKKYYVLDGYVTDHTTLTQEHSKLYHYLAGFEEDSKRKLAMETRRVDLLLPLVKALNVISYEVLHKQMAYELGETSLAQLEIKLDRLRNSAGEIDESKMKKADVTKCVEFCKLGYLMFAHFGFLYAKAQHRSGNNNIYLQHEAKPLEKLVEIECIDPDESLISEEEIRPFLNSHFLTCRILTKVVTKDTPGAKGHYLIAALRRYDWLSKFAPKLCAKKGVDIQAVFNEEIKICVDMVKLLPSKIDRVMYMGESGLSL